MGDVIETGVDKLVKIINDRGKVALSDAAKELGVSPTVIQEWADFLEEENIISVEYNLTKPYLVPRKLSKKEVREKEKEFEGKKTSFIRKAEVNLGFLERQAAELKKAKGQFDRLKSDLGMELEAVKSELSSLERYQELKQNLQKQIDEQKADAQSNIHDLTKQITREQKKYQDLISSARKENTQLRKEKAEAKSLEGGEKILSIKLKEFKSLIGKMEKKINNEDLAIKNSESHLERLNKLMEEVKRSMEEKKTAIEPLLEKNREIEKRIPELQEKIFKRIIKKQKSASEISEVAKKTRDFFSRKMGFVNLIDQVDKDREELEKSMIVLLRKAKSFHLSSADNDVNKKMLELERFYNDVDKKRNVFQSELKKLDSYFKN